MRNLSSRTQLYMKTLLALYPDIKGERVEQRNKPKTNGMLYVTSVIFSLSQGSRGLRRLRRWTTLKNGYWIRNQSGQV